MIMYALCLVLLTSALFFMLRSQSHGANASTANYPAEFMISPEHQDEALAPPVESLGMLTAEKIVTEALELRPHHFNRNFRLEAGMTQEAALRILEHIFVTEGDVSKLRWLGIRYIGEKVIEEVEVTHTKDGSDSHRLAQIVRMPDDAWKVDISSYIRHTSHPWNDILDRKVEKAVVRVIIAEASYYNGIFEDESKWRCYKISSPDFQDVLYGYVEAGSIEDFRIKNILPMDRKPQRVTLEIHSNITMLTDQFQITRLLAEDWIRKSTSDIPSHDQ